MGWPAGKYRHLWSVCTGATGSRVGQAPELNPDIQRFSRFELAACADPRLGFVPSGGRRLTLRARARIRWLEGLAQCWALPLTTRPRVSITAVDL